ncbi:hypothetical protein KY285_005144 [Solanum tuberosum]|nr:hypothetical protein KY284_005368 [Solanum tuberosum]KAH0751996.1 hypothetical protein KY285_005144 [Solanum tuberosum]
MPCPQDPPPRGRAVLRSPLESPPHRGTVHQVPPALGPCHGLRTSPLHHTQGSVPRGPTGPPIQGAVPRGPPALGPCRSPRASFAPFNHGAVPRGPLLPTAPGHLFPRTHKPSPQGAVPQGFPKDPPTLGRRTLRNPQPHPPTQGAIPQGTPTPFPIPLPKVSCPKNHHYHHLSTPHLEATFPKDPSPNPDIPGVYIKSKPFSSWDRPQPTSWVLYLITIAYASLGRYNLSVSSPHPRPPYPKDPSQNSKGVVRRGPPTLALVRRAQRSPMTLNAPPKGTVRQGPPTHAPAPRFHALRTTCPAPPFPEDHPPRDAMPQGPLQPRAPFPEDLVAPPHPGVLHSEVPPPPGAVP